MAFVRITREMLEEINVIRELQGKTLLTDRTVTAFASTINNHLTKHLKEYGSSENIAWAAFEVLTRLDTLVLPGSSMMGNKGTLLANRNTNDRFIDSVVLSNTNDGKTSLKSVSPRLDSQIKKLSQKRDRL